jgi:hypothetical protein
MNRNTIRPAAIGITAGAAAFAALFAWVEVDPWHSISERIARGKLTADERAELDRIAAESKTSNEEYLKVQERDRQRRAEQDARDAKGFDPALLITEPGTASTPQELELGDLVTEIVHAEQTLRQGSVWNTPLSLHNVALNAEWRRRDSWDARYKLSHVEILRRNILRDRLETARRAPLPPAEPVAPSAVPDSGEFVYPRFDGPIGSGDGDDAGAMNDA